MSLESVRKSEDGEVIVSVNPATTEVNDEIPATDPDDIPGIVDKARKAQEKWRDKPLRERLRVIKTFQDHLIKRREEVAEVVSSETGKPIGEAMAADIIPTLDAVRFLDDQGSKVMEENLKLSNPLVMDRTSKIVREPLGVIGMIVPWNYPFGIPGSQVVYALYAGNAVVIKPAEHTTLTALEIESLFDKAGLPDDLLYITPGSGGEVGEALVNSDVDKISFTGSTEVGEEIESTCTPRGVPTTMELGGSDPAIVLSDANKGITTDGIVWSRFSNCGQTCAAIKRVYIQSGVYDEFRDKIVEKVDKLRLGSGLDEGVDMGPLISESALNEIERQVDESVDMGADVLTGGDRVDDLDGYFYEPTVLENVSTDMPVLSEETFGPVLPLIDYADVDDAVEMANDSPYGLTASVWTRNVDRGEEVARRIDAGTVVVNDHGYTYGVNETPWGGFKDSGTGRVHGRWGIEGVTRMKHINRASGDLFPRSMRTRNTWWFPYSDDFAETMSEGVEFLYGSGVVKKVVQAPGMLRSIFGKKGL